MATEKYKCGECGDIWDDHEEALGCCPPPVIEVWKCDACGEVHRVEEDADDCCLSAGPPSESVCPECRRIYGPSDLNRTAITVAGHCQTCNPNFTYEQQHQIEGLHHHKTGNWERVNA